MAKVRVHCDGCQRYDRAVVKVIFAGYASEQKGYRFWDPAKQQLITRDAELFDIGHESSSIIQKQRTSDAIFVPPLSVTTPSQMVIERKVNQDVIEEKPIEASKAQEESNHVEIQEPQLRRSERTTRGIMNRYMR